MKSTLISIVLCLNAVFLYAQTQSEKQVLDLSLEKFQWQVNKDWKSLGELMHDSIIIQHGNGNLQHKEEYFKTVTSGMLEYKTADAFESSVRLFDQTAIVMGRVKFHILFNGEPRDYQFRYTDVYGWVGNQWKLVLYSVRNIE